MAAMDIRKARALAEQRIRSGQNNGLGLEDLVQQIIAESAVAPGTAIGAAMIPRVELTPAQTAPGQPGVQLVAPKPTAPAPAPEQAAPERPAPRPSRFRQMLDSTITEIGATEDAMRQAAESGQPVNIIEQARLRGLRGRAQQLQDRVQAEETAALPEEMQTVFNRQQERLGRREELLAEAKARSPWEALIAGGAALAQGRRGERFTEALARGLQAGVQQYGRSRQEAEEGTENIAEARDQIVMNRYNAIEKARADAVAMVNSGQEIDERTLRLSKLTSDEALNLALAPFAVRKGQAEATKAEAEARFAPERQKAEIAYYNNRGEGRGGAKVDVEARADRDELDDAAAEYESARTIYNEALRENKMMASMVPAEVKSAFLASKAKLEQRSKSFARRYGASPYIGGQAQGAAPTRTAITADPLGIRR